MKNKNIFFAFEVFLISLSILVFILFALLINTNFVLAAATDCWQYTSTNNASCTLANGCVWKIDSWGGYCTQLSCWSLETQNQCSTTNVPGKNCTWQPTTTYYFCEQISCWSFSGTNNNTCVLNSVNKSCAWQDSCYSVGGNNCYSQTTQANCLNTTGCAWGQCYQKNCYDYITQNTCKAGRDWQGNNCTWSASSSSCKENSCWNTDLYANETACNSATGVNCQWKWNSCQTKGCWTYDFTNVTACVNNTAGLACTWSGGSYCNTDSCYTVTNNNTCAAKSGCRWGNWTSSPYCKEVNCWNWDSWSGGNQSLCENNNYSMSCTWTGNPAGNKTNGWCYQAIASKSCGNFTTERGCMDTYYCWWNSNDWMNSSKGGNCTEPTWGNGTFSNTSLLNDWNPGCYIFDVNSTKCNNVLGCNYTTSGGTCDTLTGAGSYGENITKNGISCTNINDSALCNGIASLSSCCTWQNSSCVSDRYSSACVSQLAQTPHGEKSCEDADTKSSCDTIAGDPWYMPCSWSNSTEKCSFKATSVFGNTSQSLLKIENKRNCEAAGGKWITENYCEGNVSVPTGRCEYKFDEEENCDKACFACELKNSDGKTVNSTNAREACVNSKLGFCEFTKNSNAPNSIGYCNAKLAWKSGIAGDCDTSCGDCTYKGDPLNNDTTKKPSYYCTTSKANSDGGGCKWITDNSTANGGYCVKKGEKICEDACDRCKTQSDCTTIGRKSVTNQTGSCKWQGSSNDGSCVANIAGDVEVCWDGEDNDADGLIDCSDAGCYSDSFCGLTLGDCFGWTNNNTCADKGCEWVVDKWGSWCDFKGSQCWRYEKNESFCTGVTAVFYENKTISGARIAGNNLNESINFILKNVGGGIISGSVNVTNASGFFIGTNNYTLNYTNGNLIFLNTTYMVSGGGIANITNITYQYYFDSVKKNCGWSNGTGNSWCERDWSVNEVCMGLNRTQCSDNSNCVFTNDTWCDTASAKSSSWCSNFSGWCDHKDFAPKNCWQKTSNSTCNSVSGCNWKIDTWSKPHCEVNWSGNCWQKITNDSCNAIGCIWKNETYGSWNSAWCDNNMSDCWSSYNQVGCQAKGAKCSWRNESGGSYAYCQPSCFNSTLDSSQNSCGTVNGCYWKAENGWCEEQQSANCYGINVSSQANCTGTNGCKWKSPGWCSPKDGGFTVTSFSGGGVGNAGGGDCYKYDGNKSLCTNKTITNVSCGWIDNPSQACQVDWSRDCSKYSTVAAGCTAANGCWFKNDSFGAWCMNIFDQCWSNSSLTTNLTACNLNVYCQNTSYGCQPACFNATSTSTCSAISGCKWNSGWCNPSSMNNLFDGMESGAPVPLGTDTCGGAGETSQRSVDICGFGMKDMVDAYGFGVNVNDFSNASICNKEKISSFVTGMSGGAFGAFGAEKVGAGNDTVIYFVYLDTDGASKGNCELTHNSSADGYEFRFKYTSEWNASTSKSKETFNSYKCENSKWIGTDIKLSTMKQKMCGEIGGPMIAVQKADLTKYPTLYDSTKDIRVYVATIGNTGNVSSPSDTAGPGYTTPGSIDFEITDAFSYGADTAKFEGILSKGFVQYEDCFNSVDDDQDGNVDCSDWNCQYSSQCSSSGVNSAGYNDTSTAKVIGVKIEEYPDSALLIYDTNKPTNGTLEFYANDSRCLTLNKSIHDIGITSTQVRDYKLWHTGEVYSTNLGYALTNDTTYYYKLRACDSGGRCALSKCSSFTTTNSISKCGYCNFVSRIKVPSGWNVSYDINKDGVYEHKQGEVCGGNAGLKGNYTLGRSVNIKMASTDNRVYFEFLNASLTKTGLNDKVRTISNASNILNTSVIVGLTSETRDKIINNLHPEICRIKVPYSGTCNSLFHCDDSGANCIDKTSSSTLLDSTNCIWQISNCEFSSYRESTTTDSGSSGSSSSGGAGGAGGGIAPSNKTKANATAAGETGEGETAGGGGVTGEATKETPQLSPESGLGGINPIYWIASIIGVVVIVIVISVYYGMKHKKRKSFGY